MSWSAAPLPLLQLVVVVVAVGGEEAVAAVAWGAAEAMAAAAGHGLQPLPSVEGPWSFLPRNWA